jgi:hypothetical protein
VLVLATGAMFSLDKRGLQEMQTKITMILQPKLSVAVVEFLLYLLELT